MTTVIWNSGHESGFRDKTYAQRFIDRVCKITAPDLRFIIGEQS